jgi:hypothetical protein
VCGVDCSLLYKTKNDGFCFEIISFEKNCKFDVNKVTDGTNMLIKTKHNMQKIIIVQKHSNFENTINQLNSIFYIHFWDLQCRSTRHFTERGN